MQSAQTLSTQINIITNNIREQLSNEIEEDLEYIRQTTGLNNRVTLPLIKYKSGKIYGGKWKNGMKDGKGRFLWPDGTVYVDDWEENVSSQWGKLTLAYGRIYEGEQKNNKANVKGKYFHANGDIEIGRMISNMEMELKGGKIVQSIKENIRKGKNMEEVFVILQMDLNIKVHFQKMIQMVMVLMFGQTKECKKENGRMIK